jgi:hypothetical protein
MSINDGQVPEEGCRANSRNVLQALTEYTSGSGKCPTVYESTIVAYL